MQGFDVFEPIGLDGFGIHSENFALKVGKHPMDLSKKTENNIYVQLHAIGNGFAWSNKLETYDTNYYKWTQWIFVQLFKRGLAYRAKASVNWCPDCKTVLADEQVVSKSQRAREPESQSEQVTSYKLQVTSYVCERCGTEVEKRELEQWFFRITNYAQRLLSGLDKIDWSEKVKIAQRNWLGKSEGLLLKFESDIESNITVEVFTTRPDTLYGVTFMALAPEHPQVTKILDKSKGLLKRQIQKYVTDSIKKPEAERIGLIESEKQKDSEFVKTGIKTPFHCTNPVSGKQLPIFIADYVVMSYGTGAVMGVPAHDQRDYLFAKKYHIDIVEVIKPAGPVDPGTRGPVGSSSRSTSSPALSSFRVKSESRSSSRKSWVRALSGTPSAAATPRAVDQLSQEAFTDLGLLVNSEKFSGLKSQEAIKAISNFAVKKGFGTKKVMWHLRDWIISRQRYWGSPIPMIFCEKCYKTGKSWFSTNEAKELLKGMGISNLKFPISNENSKLKIKNSVQWATGWPASNASRSDAGWYPVPESDLPVELPYIENFKPTHSTSSGQAGMGPLAKHPEFYKVFCPACGALARRETDVSDTFLDSAWYFLRYPSVKEENSKLQTPNPKKLEFGNWDLGIPWDRQITKRWLPVDMYIGGAEHSVLHLLYSRFLTMAFYDMDLIDFQEPFSKFRAHGLLIKEGAKMSKSKGNVVLPDPYIAKYGTDTLRTYLMFCGRFDQGGDFRDTGIEGMHRFLKRVWRLVTGKSKFEIRNSKLSSEAAYLMHKTIKKVSEDIENLRYNTAISTIMEWVGTLEKRAVGSYEGVVGSKNKNLPTTNYELITEEEVKNLLLLLAPFAPHMTEELWSRLQTTDYRLQQKKAVDSRQWTESIHIHPWPKYDPKLATSQKIELVVEVNGKVRDKIVVDRGIEKEDAQKQALEQENTQKHLDGKTPQKVIFVRGRLINFVV